MKSTGAAPASPTYQMDDDAYQTGPIVETTHGRSVDVEFPVRTMAEVNRLRSLKQQALRHLEDKKWDEAVDTTGEVLRVHPSCIGALQVRSKALEHKGQYAEALAELEAIVRIIPDYFSAPLFAAELLASAPDDTVRDGKRTVELAAAALTAIRANSNSGKDALLWPLRTLAAAHDEAGDFDQAVKRQQEALELAPDDKKDEYRKRLDLYRAKQPYRSS